MKIVGDLLEKSVNEGDLGLPQGRHGYEGDWYKMREPPPKWGSVGSSDLAMVKSFSVPSSFRTT